MVALIMTIVGGAFLGLSFGVGLGNEKPNKKNISLVLCFLFGIFLFGFGIRESYTGNPKTSIKAGSYKVMGYVEVSQDNQSYYQMILEQDGKVKLYALPKDMINVVYQLPVPETSGKPGTLEVIEKSGLRRATFYIPFQK